jgi:hypothetical protein
MDTSDARKAAQFLWGVIFYGGFLIVTFMLVYLCYNSYELYMLRGDFKDIAVVIFMTVFYIFVSAKIFPFRNTPANNEVLSFLYIFLTFGHNTIKYSTELGNQVFVLTLLGLFVSGYWLSTALRKLKSGESPE